MNRHLVSLIVVGIVFICLPVFLDGVDKTGQLRQKFNQVALNEDPWTFCGAVLILTAVHLMAVRRRESTAASVKEKLDNLASENVS